MIQERDQQLTSIELFTGAGGLALGVAKAGFKHKAVVELNPHACASLNANRSRVALMSDWPTVEPQNVRDFNFSEYSGAVSLIAAGAPCQPFSLGGKHRGHADERNLFPEVFRATREVLPPAVLIENVKGLLRSSFRPYFEYIKLALSLPELEPLAEEDWSDHEIRLKSALAENRYRGVRYRVAEQLVNAADFGVPQKRERVFIIALRQDISGEWKGIKPTHSEDALLVAKWIDGSYWEEHNLFKPPVPARLSKRIEKLKQRRGSTKRWQTVRDALKHYPPPVDYREHPTLLNHVGNPGARSYKGHTGSSWDEPAKTLKAGDHGVPGGENMLRDDDGSVRYFTVREAARLQTFPDEYAIQGAWTEGFRQLGNAVPVELAYHVASELKRVILGEKLDTSCSDYSEQLSIIEEAVA
jgi:DNA (cytosine-5)-methyltransferase 1